MFFDSIKFSSYRCFKNDWSGFDSVKPINVIIGKNNSGKSQLLDLVEASCDPRLFQKRFQLRCGGVLDETSLKSVFKPQNQGGGLKGDWWTDNGESFVGQQLYWEADVRGEIRCTTTPKLTEFSHQGAELQRHLFLEIAKSSSHRLSRFTFRRLSAERDIRPEQADVNLTLSSNGNGATNIIRRYLVSSSAQLPSDLIQHTLLDALNEIFRQAATFTGIEIKQHDEHQDNQPLNSWEVFLAEDKKGLISLSRSGSGLKTVLLVLLNLLVVPEINSIPGPTIPKGRHVFAFEELENNLHPALLRRLFRYLEDYVVRENSTIFLTTHSSVALDLFGVSKHAQIVYVTHDGESASTQTVAAHFDRLGIISELGAKPSDLLQANGIVWVEGPSDRIYLNRWIELFSEAKYKEGRDYQCAFYGGALLARTQFRSPDDSEQELVNLLSLNSNIVMVCDGDRTEPEGSGSALKARVKRIEQEVKKIPGALIWITEAKEIENYLPGSVLGKIFNVPSPADPGQHERFFANDTGNASYVESQLKKKNVDKVSLAIEAVPHMTKDLMKGRFDCGRQMEQIVEVIRRWNA